MALKETNSNEELNARGRQLLMLLPNETTPLQEARVFQHSDTGLLSPNPASDISNIKAD